MLIKQVVAIMVLSSLICNAANAVCSVKHVKTDSVKQARKLIKHYDSAKKAEDRQCTEEKMRDLLSKLTQESDVFGGAMQDEAMSGELEASIVNEKEQVALKKSIQLLQNKLGTIDGQEPSDQKRKAEPTESGRELKKRRRATN